MQPFASTSMPRTSLYVPPRNCTFDQTNALTVCTVRLTTHVQSKPLACSRYAEESACFVCESVSPGIYSPPYPSLCNAVSIKTITENLDSLFADVPLLLRLGFFDKYKYMLIMCRIISISLQCILKFRLPVKEVLYISNNRTITKLCIPIMNLWKITGKFLIHLVMNY